MAVAKLDLHDRSWTDDGLLNAGGKIYTYAADTTTPLATFTDSTGLTANENPIILDASGNAHIWLTEDAAYKFVFADADDVVYYTENGILIRGASASATNAAYTVAYNFKGGPPPSSDELWRYVFERAVDFPANFSGSFGSTGVPPTGSFVETLKKNGSTIGTITTSTGGVSAFASAGGGAVSFLAGDVLTSIGPASADATIANFARTFAGLVG